MAALDELVAASKAYIANPFLDETAYARAQATLRAARRDATVALEQLVTADRKSHAKRVVVAFMTLARFDAEIGRPTAPLTRIEDSMLHALDLERTAMLRVAAAAVRCHVQLRRFVGTSGAAVTARAATWSATFGKSLYDGWKQRADIRSHNVLLRGESGTGKEILARAIQLGAITENDRDAEAEPAMADINASSISKQLLESELFGHVKGAFSDAHEDREGLFEVANGGTLFLDEIADLDPEHQPKLLRVLQERRVARVGSNTQRSADVRVIAATSRPLDKLIESDRFREDLYHRLNGSEIRIPPLRERHEDVAVIARSVAEGLQSAQSQPDDPNLSKLIGHLADYHWPGNVRELVTMVRSHLLSMPDPGRSTTLAHVDTGDLREFFDKVRGCQLTLKQVEEAYMRLVLKAENNVQERAAKRLGINRSTLASRLKAKD